MNIDKNKIIKTNESSMNNSIYSKFTFAILIGSKARRLLRGGGASIKREIIWKRSDSDRWKSRRLDLHMTQSRLIVNGGRPPRIVHERPHNVSHVKLCTQVVSSSMDEPEIYPPRSSRHEEIPFRELMSCPRSPGLDN